MEKDIRTEDSTSLQESLQCGPLVELKDNLLLGDPASTGRMWLAPYVRQPSNAIELVFDEPTRMSCIRFWTVAECCLHIGW
eukprot:4117894-Amphidinium_carterae.1